MTDSTPTTYLVVPMQLDALFVNTDHYAVQGPKADFSILPYQTNQTGDVNSNTAYVGESIHRQAFENNIWQLRRGVHLHWALPEGLTRGVQLEDEQGNIQFPRVPNRWLITRINHEKQEKQWIVESDYLYSEGVRPKIRAVTIPVEGDGQPFRYLGRSMPFSVWEARKKDVMQKAEYLDRLTAVGYGEATFAAFYPNCHSVFGFCDEEVKDVQGLTYEVIGWYSDEAQDELSRVFEQCAATQDALKTIEEKFGWILPEGFDGAGRLLCAAQLQFSESFDTQYPDPRAKPTITVGNTPSEALAAALSKHLEQEPKLQEQVEDQLEAVQLSAQLQERLLDIKSRFSEIRHENRFVGHQYEFSWEIIQLRDETKPDEKELKPLPPVPDAINQLLDQANVLQDDYDHGLAIRTSLREQLFADWYKYMITACPPDGHNEQYPDLDEVKYFINKKSLQPIEENQSIYGTLEVKEDEQGGFESCSADKADTVAGKLTEVLNALMEKLGKLTGSSHYRAIYQLKRIPDPRFWEAADPAVFMEGDGVKLTKRVDPEDTAALLEIQGPVTFTVDAFGAWKEVFRNALTSDFRTLQDQQPWNSFLMDWEVQTFPLREASSVAQDRNYRTDFVKNYYEMRQGLQDLLLKHNLGKIERGATYLGTSLLSPSASELLREGIRKHVEKLGLIEQFEAEAGLEFDWSEEHLSDLIERYGNKESHKPGVLLQLKALVQLSKIAGLAQQLGGLTQALRMRKHTLSFPIDDPLAFGHAEDTKNYRHFSTVNVSNALGADNPMAPDPFNHYSPIRNGVLKLNQLRLVDTFGQTKQLNCSEINSSSTLNQQGSRYLTHMPPRISQPTRLTMRWLSKEAWKNEIRPARSEGAVLGWFMVNKLDNSLQVYNTKGEALGYFKAGDWHKAIHSEQATGIDQVSNLHLRRVLQQLQADSWSNSMMNVIAHGVSRMLPETPLATLSIGALLGKPIALIRADVSLELWGNPAPDQSWEAFKQDWGSAERRTRGFTNVRFPVRIGEYQKRNNGLIGFWVEQEMQGEIVLDKNHFYHLEKPGKLSSSGDQSDLKDTNFELSISGQSQQVCMFMHPAGQVHAATGILPLKTVSLPTANYQVALERMEVSILAAPLLTSTHHMELLLPADRNRQWSWVEQKRTEDSSELWQQIDEIGRLKRQDFLNHWNESTFARQHGGEQLWNYLISIEIHWLAPVSAGHSDQASLVPAEQRATDELKEYSGLEAFIDRLLDDCATYIKPLQTYADWSAGYEFREGWIKIGKKFKP